MKIRNFKELEKDILESMEQKLVSNDCFCDDSFEIWLNKEYEKILKEDSHKDK